MNIEQPNLDQNESTPLNNRKEAMLRELNEKTGSTHLLTEKGYDEAGRSEGILEKLVALGEDREELKAKFLSISRGKK